MMCKPQAVKTALFKFHFNWYIIKCNDYMMSTARKLFTLEEEDLMTGVHSVKSIDIYIYIT